MYQESTGVDTRSITKKIRNAGVMRGTMVSNADNLDAIVASLKAYELPVDEIQMNSTKEIKKYAGEGPRVVLLDFGFKDNILAELLKRGCEVILAPWNTSADEILAFKTGWHHVKQRTWRSDIRSGSHRNNQAIDCAGKSADVRNLSRAPVDLISRRCDNLQNEIRSPRRKSSG